MVVFIGAIGTAITQALTWGIYAAKLVQELLQMVLAGVTTVALIRTSFMSFRAEPVA